MHCDGMALNVSEDPFIGGWSAAGIMLGRQAVDRDDQVQPPDACLGGGDRTYPTGDELDTDAHHAQARQQDVQFTQAD